VSIIGEYIALHALVPQNELPHNLRGKIPDNEIWIRSDKYTDKEIKDHESFELVLMDAGLNYKTAHYITEEVRDTREWQS